MEPGKDEDRLLHQVALQNAASILHARQRAERELVEAKDALERRSVQLARSLAAMRATLESTTDAILVTDHSGKIVNYNEQFLRLWQISKSKIDDLDLDSVRRQIAQHAIDPSAFLARLREIDVSGTAESFDMLELKDGRSVERLSKIQTVDGETVGRVWSFRDITARQRTQRALSTSHAQFSAIVHNSPTGILVLDSQLRFQQVNPAASPIFVEDPTGKSLESVLTTQWPLDVAAPLIRHHNETLRTGEPYYAKGFTAVRKDRRIREHYDWELHRILLPNGQQGVVSYVTDISSHARSQEALLENAQRLQLALAAGHLGDWQWEAATDQVTLGPGAAEIFGVPADTKIPRQRLLELVHRDDRERARYAMSTAIDERTDYHLEYRVVRAPGEEVWVAARGRAAYRSDGSVSGMIGYVQDVTERRRLEEVRLRLAAVVESSDDAIISKDLRGVIETWNSGAERIFGYRAEEVIGKPISLLIPPDHLAEEPEILRRLAAGQRIEPFETVRLRKNGERFPVSLTVSPIKDDDGRIIGASKIARDISDKRRAEERLHEESKILSILNSTGELVASDLDLETLAQKITDATTELSGAQLGAFYYGGVDNEGFELLASSGASRDSFESDIGPELKELAAATFRGAPPIRFDDVGAEAADRTRGGREFNVRSFLAVPVTSRAGDVIGALLFGHTEPRVFTERVERILVGIASQAAVGIDNARLYDRVKRASEERQIHLDAERAARAEAERASVLKDEFLATLSHELRTPLNAIVGWSQVLKSLPKVDKDVLEGLNVIDRNAKMQAQLIEDLLDMSRIISGKIRLDSQRVDLKEVLAAAVASVRLTAESKGIHLSVSVDPLGAAVWGDPSRLQQCVWNLLTNAIKFTPKAGAIEVGLTRVDSHLEIDVADNGLGIAPEFLPHVFEKFRQADASTTRHHGGLGLGLSIVKSIIELHGGSVHARSAGIDRGSTFTIELPIMAVDTKASEAWRSAHASVTPRALEPLSLEGITVLAVDDEYDGRMLVKRVLEDSGARVLLASSAKEGLELVMRGKPDMIVSDIGMPDEDGIQFIRSVRQLRPDEGGRTPAAALSAFARAEDRTRALRAGYQAHVAKPVDPGELVAMIASLSMRR